MFPDNSPLLAAMAPYGDQQILLTDAASFRFMPEGSVTFDLDPATPEYTAIAWSEAELQYVRELFAYVSTLIDVTFTETSSDTASMSFYKVPDLGELAGYNVYTAPGQSSVVLDSEYTTDTIFGDDNTTVIHEIGHALGLSHPFDGPAVLPGVTGQFSLGDFSLNTSFATRLSYNESISPLHPGLEITGEASTLGALDIAMLQQLYGMNTQTAAGDTNYGDTRQLETIWDAGGHDLIDFSGVGSAAVIDLRAATLMADAGGAGYLSYVSAQNGAVAEGGYVIAYGAVIEDARGGAGNDRITGNEVGNLLSGNGGNDTIDGGGGVDTALFSGNQESYTLTLSQAGTTVMDRRGTDGTDTLSNIEALAFGESTIAPFGLVQFDGAVGLEAAAMESFVELYIAYFNRAPDAIGLNFWGTAFARGTSLSEMATLFIDQDETRATYPEGLSNADFATAVYANVLGRVADAAGFDFWVGVLDNGSVGRDQFILSVLEGAKAAPPDGASEDFIIQQIADRQYLSTKTDIGTYYAVTKGLSNVADASAAMALFTGSASSITAARDAIDDYHAAALDAESGAFLMPLVGVLDDPFAGLA